MSKSLAKATGVVSFFTFLSRILGLVRDVVIANYFGAGRATDAFFVAFKVPNLLRRLVAEGSLSTAFVPVFTDEKQLSDDHGRRAVGAVASFTALLTIVLTALGIIFAAEITLVFAPGFSAEPGKVALATSLMQLMFPYIVLVSLLALAASVLNSLGHFGAPAAAPAILNVVMISFVVLLSQSLDEPIVALAWAVLVGGTIALIPQLILLRRVGFPLHFRSPFGSPAVSKLCTLMLPSVLSASLYQIMVFLNTLLASMLVEKSVSWLFYADRVFQFPLGVFTLAVATAVLPSLSKHASSGNIAALGEQLGTALRWITVVTIPATVGLIVLAEPIISTIYQHGKFGADDARQTSLALQAFAIGLWSVSCQSIVVRGFLAQKNALLPAAITCVSIAINIVLAFALMGAPQVEISGWFSAFLSQAQQTFAIAELGHVGLALAGSLSSLIALVPLTLLLRRVDIHLAFGELGGVVLRTLAASGAMWLALQYFLRLEYPALANLLVGIPLGFATYLLASLILKSPEAGVVVSKLRRS